MQLYLATKFHLSEQTLNGSLDLEGSCPLISRKNNHQSQSTDRVKDPINFWFGCSLCCFLLTTCCNSENGGTQKRKKCRCTHNFATSRTFDFCHGFVFQHNIIDQTVNLTFILIGKPFSHKLLMTFLPLLFACTNSKSTDNSIQCTDDTLYFYPIDLDTEPRNRFSPYHNEGPQVAAFDVDQDGAIEILQCFMDEPLIQYGRSKPSNHRP